MLTGFFADCKQTRDGQNCIFPFKYQGKWRYGCQGTIYGSWCATKVNWSTRQATFAGICPHGCVEGGQTTTTTTTTTTPKPKTGMAFPLLSTGLLTRALFECSTGSI